MTVEKIEDKAYDVLIKITNLNSFRTKKRTPNSKSSTNRISSLTSKHDKIDRDCSIPKSIQKLTPIEIEIYKIIASREKGIKAVNIGSLLNLPRRDINHYLYSTLRGYLRIDHEYKGHIK